MPIGPDTDRNGAGRGHRDVDPVAYAWAEEQAAQWPARRDARRSRREANDLGDLGAAPVLADKLSSDGGK